MGVLNDTQKESEKLKLYYMVIHEWRNIEANFAPEGNYGHYQTYCAMACFFKRYCYLHCFAINIFVEL